MGSPSIIYPENQAHGRSACSLQLSMVQQPQKQTFYGDVVNAIMLSIGTVFFAHRLHTEKVSSGIYNFHASIIVCTMALSAAFQGLAWKSNNLLCSRIAFLGNLFVGTYIEIHEWPFQGVCAMNQLSPGGVINLCLANISLSLQEKIIRLILLSGVVSYVSITSPYSDFIKDTLPYYGPTLLAAFSALYIFHESEPTKDSNDDKRSIHENPRNKIWFNIRIQKEEVIVRIARMTLGAIYVHHAYRVCREVILHKANSENTLEALFGLAQASFIASIGSIATGVFKTNIDQKEQLERLVKKRTHEIRLKNKELRRINIAFKACETAIAITDASRTVIWSNQAFEGLAHNVTTMPKQQPIPTKDAKKATDGSSIGQLLTDLIVLDRPADERKPRGAFEFVSPRLDEIEILEKDGKGIYLTRRQYHVEVTPFIDNNEFDSQEATKGKEDCTSIRNKTLFLVSFSDITADRAREQAEQSAHDEALISKAMKESMVTLTHELRTPLQGIMGITSLLLEQKDSERDQEQRVKDTSESLGLIMASSSLLLNLINNLLDVKKATANMMDEFLLAPLLASDPIRDAIDFCNPLASISKVNIVMSCEDATKNYFVNANALRLQQVLINFISNAIKYTEQETEIHVRTYPSTVRDTLASLKKSIAHSSNCDTPDSLMLPERARVLVFSVTDSGPGIEESQALRLFHRFAMLNQQPTRTLGSNKTGQPSGSGLGLHLCQMFVQKMQGWIWVENNDGRGATFSFCLPLVESPEASSEDLVSSSFGAERPVSHPPKNISPTETITLISDYRKLRVLVVDDTLINRKVLDRMLKKIGVLEITLVESGTDALKELLSPEKRYDIVITDLQMPGMSGIELSKEISKKQKECKHGGAFDLPVIGLTADTSPGLVEKCAESGMSDLLYKPITLVEIKEYFQSRVAKLRPGFWRQSERQSSFL